MFFRSTVLFCLFSSFLAGFSQNGGIKGYVKDLKSGNEIDNANIQLAGTEYGSYSNQDGYFIINDVKPGKYKLIAGLNGYEADTVNVEILPSKIIVINLGWLLSRCLFLIQ